MVNGNDTERISVNKTNKRNRRRRRGKNPSSSRSTTACPNAIPDTSLFARASSAGNAIVPSIYDTDTDCMRMSRTQIELENKRLKEEVEHLKKILATSVTELSKLEKELLDSEYQREILERTHRNS